MSLSKDEIMKMFSKVAPVYSIFKSGNKYAVTLENDSETIYLIQENGNMMLCSAYDDMGSRILSSWRIVYEKNQENY